MSTEFGPGPIAPRFSAGVPAEQDRPSVPAPDGDHTLKTAVPAFRSCGWFALLDVRGRKVTTSGLVQSPVPPGGVVVGHPSNACYYATFKLDKAAGAELGPHRAVESFDLAGRGWRPGLSQLMIDAVFPADSIEQHLNRWGGVFAGEYFAVEFLTDVKRLRLA